MTKEILNKGKSENDGWSRKQLRVLGERWPLESGWMARILSKDYPEAVIGEFLALTSAHLREKEERRAAQKEQEALGKAVVSLRTSAVEVFPDDPIEDVVLKFADTLRDLGIDVGMKKGIPLTVTLTVPKKMAKSIRRFKRQPRGM